MATLRHRIKRMVAREVTAAHHWFVKVPQRMPVQVAFGVVMILGSHFAVNGEQTWLRDTGSAIVTISFTRWLAQQGQRRRTPDGKPLRNPTIRFKLKDPE